MFRSASLEPRCPKCKGYDIDIARGTIKEQSPNETKCKKCGKVSTFKADGWCKDCWDKDDLSEAYSDPDGCEWCGKPAPGSLLCTSCKAKQKAEWDAPVDPKKAGAINRDLKKYGLKEEAEKLLCHDCGFVWMGSFPAKCPECGCRKCVTTDEPLSEEYAMTTYFTGDDKDGWVLMHQGQPLNANPQNGIPVDRERVQRVAKQFGFKDVMVWNGKNYTYSFGESTEGNQCAQCKKPMNPVQALMGTVCGDCTRKNHAAATKGFDKAYTSARGGK